MAAMQVERDERGWLKPGSVLNPKGRPKGSRDALREDFFEALLADFRASGADAIAKAREDNPAAYLAAVTKVVVASMPKQVDVGIDGVAAFMRVWDAISAGAVAGRMGQEPGQPKALRDGRSGGDAGSVAG